MQQSGTVQNAKTETGSGFIFAAVVLFIFATVAVAVLAYASSELRVLRSSVNREQAFYIAEAGVNYYQWRLAHFPADFTDGTGTAGPYVHNFYDVDTGQQVGSYSLTVTAPPIGSTVATIQSTGYTLDNPKVRRTITVRYGIPSLAQYGFLTNSDVWIGDTETVQGQFHANGGVRFDGLGNAPITSAKATYTCQTYHGCGPTTKNGIWGSAATATQAFWSYPVPNVDFSAITSDLANLKSTAQSGGIYLPPSNALGYSIVMATTGTTTLLSVYKVTTVTAHQTGWDVNSVAHNEDIDYNARTLQYTTTTPPSGVVYAEDHVWIEGGLRGRLTVAAARLPYNPATAPNIYIPRSLLYQAKDGQHSLGLIAQKSVVPTYSSSQTLEIDAAMIAQNGSVQHYYYPGNVKSAITVYGSLSSYGVWTWSWVDGGGTTVSGYQTTNTVYDQNLLYGPPPSFPVSSAGYQQISWSSN